MEPADCPQTRFTGCCMQLEATVRTLREGRPDADGSRSFAGRFNDVIKVSGCSVLPVDGEAWHVEHQALAQAGQTIAASKVPRRLPIDETEDQTRCCADC